ncbi:MAG TPA: hypothetical protein EYN79_01615, partial [Planctomycetes bacterium]|nr:hypothetical protein [Planctomycetota bacterium]
MCLSNSPRRKAPALPPEGKIKFRGGPVTFPFTLARVSGVLAILLLLALAPESKVRADEVLVDSAQVQIFGAEHGDHLGRSSSGAGDVNGDGSPDLVIGAPGAETDLDLDDDDDENDDDDLDGKAYLILGSGELPAEIDLADSNEGVVISILGPGEHASLGWSVSGAGDINSDGFDDFVIGAPDADHGSRDECGAAFLIYGSPSLPMVISTASLGSLGVTLHGPTKDAHAGYSVSGAGDFNNDGFDDVLIGAPGADIGGHEESGIAYLLLGGNSLPESIDLRHASPHILEFRGSGEERHAGRAVSDIGDFNGDGVADIGITEPGDDHDESGRAHVIFGSATLPAEVSLGDIASSGLQSMTIDGGGQNNNLGRSISSAGDPNDDGFSDVLIGSGEGDDDDDDDDHEGSAFLILGSASPPTSLSVEELDGAGTEFYNLSNHEALGHTVHNTLDVTGDGQDDFLLGSPRYKAEGTRWGAAFRVPGGTDPLPVAIDVNDLASYGGLRYRGVQNNGKNGSSVAGPGDVNGDQGFDLMIGSHRFSPYGRSHAGAARLFFGQPLFSPTAFSCTAIGTAISINWENGARYDYLELYRDGVLLETLSPETTRYVETDLAFGTHHYEILGFRRGLHSATVSCDIEVLVPISDFQCSASADQVALSWTNGTLYQTIDVYRDGELIASIPGTSESHVDNGVAVGLRTYSLIARSTNTETLAIDCSITVLAPPFDAACSSVAGAVSLTWSNGSLYEEIVLTRNGAFLASLAGDATSYNDSVTPGTYTYEIQGIADDGRSESAVASCTIVDPNAVINLHCSAVAGDATITWTNKDSYTSIEVEVVGVTGEVVPGDATSATIGGLQPGSYEICVTGVVGNGISAPSCCNLVIPIPITDLSCSATGHAVTLNWSNSEDYDQIDIFRDGIPIADIPGTMTSYTDSDVASGPHTYSVVATIRKGTTAPVSCDIDVLDPPTDLVCFTTAGVAELTWTNPSSYDVIELLRDGVLIATLAGDTTSFSEGGLQPGSYVYELFGILGNSISDTAKCTPVVPIAVTNVGCSLQKGTNVAISWAPAVEGESLEILRGGDLIATLGPEETSYLDLDVSPGVYEYCVVVVIGLDRSVPSCCEIIIPFPPFDLSCIVTLGGAHLEWANGELYDSISITRDGTQIADLPGGTTSYVDPDLQPGTHSYAVSGRIGTSVSTEVICDVFAPYPPSELACSLLGGTDAVLTWVNTEPSTAIEVYRDGDLIVSLPPDSSGYTDESVVPGLHEYCVINRFGEKTSVATCCTILVPVPPSGMTCSVDLGVASISWTNGEAYDLITLSRDGSVIAVLAGDATSYSEDLTADPGPHSYSVTGTIGEFESAAASCDVVVPSQAANLTCALSGGVDAHISWTNTDVVETISVYRDGSLIATLDTSTKEYVDAGVSPGTYEYCLVYSVGGSTGAESCCQLVVPVPPSSLDCTSTGTGIELNWINGELYDSVIVSRDGTVIAELGGDTTTYTDPFVPAGTYNYEVTGSLGGSISGAVACTVTVLDPPANLVCTFYGQPVNLSWDLTRVYDHVIIERGTEMFMLDGDVTTYQDLVPSSGTYTYCVYGMYSDGVSASVVCTGTILDFVRGDANNDTNCDIADGIWILNWLFQGGPTPAC